MNRQQRRAAKRGQTPHHGRGDFSSAGDWPAAAGLLAAGLANHQSGRLVEAEACYQQVLAVHPDHADANNLLGVMATQTGRQDLAVDLIRRALRQNERSAVYLGNLGTALKRLGRLDEAVDTYRRVVQITPDDAGAHYNLGTALFDQG